MLKNILDKINILFNKPSSNNQDKHDLTKEPKDIIINRKKFYDGIRRLGKLKQKQVDSINILLDLIERDKRWKSLPHLAYFLATVKHETADTYAPVVEYRSDRSSEAKYGYKTRIGRVLGNTKKGDGAAFKGVGYVQVTGRGNAKRLEPVLGVNLTKPTSNFRKQLKQPLNSYNAAVHGMYTGLFTGKKLQDYDTGTGFDAYNARRIINGTDRASLIRNYYKTFLAAFKESTTINSK